MRITTPFERLSPMLLFRYRRGTEKKGCAHCGQAESTARLRLPTLGAVHDLSQLSGAASRNGFPGVCMVWPDGVPSLHTQRAGNTYGDTGMRFTGGPASLHSGCRRGSRTGSWCFGASGTWTRGWPGRAVG
jgi:hypothetical protein